MKPFNPEVHEKKEVNVGDVVMHGDVIIEMIKELPENFNQLEKSTDDCLAYGELSGHLHKLNEGDFEIRIDSENPNNRFFIVTEPTALRHQEHKEVILPAGKYRSRIQREYDPFTKKIREVAD